MKFSTVRAACLMGIGTLIVQQGFSLYWGDQGAPEAASGVALLFPIFWIFFLLFHLLVLRLSKVSGRLFITWYIGLLGLKIFLAMLSILLYGYFNSKGLYPFVSVFLPLYAILTAIQVGETLAFLRKKDRRTEEEG